MAQNINYPYLDSTAVANYMQMADTQTGDENRQLSVVELAEFMNATFLDSFPGSDPVTTNVILSYLRRDTVNPENLAHFTVYYIISLYLFEKSQEHRIEYAVLINTFNRDFGNTIQPQAQAEAQAEALAQAQAQAQAEAAVRQELEEEVQLIREELQRAYEQRDNAYRAFAEQHPLPQTQAAAAGPRRIQRIGNVNMDEQREIFNIITRNRMNVSLNEYIDENTDNIVIIYQDYNNENGTWGPFERVFTIERSTIQRVDFPEFRGDGSAGIYPCERARLGTVIRDVYLFNFRQIGFHTQLQYSDISVLRDNPDAQLFILRPQGTIYPAFASWGVVDAPEGSEQANFTSAQHCQGDGEDTAEVGELVLPDALAPGQVVYSGGSKNKRNKSNKKTKKNNKANKKLKRKINKKSKRKINKKKIN